MNIIDYCVVAFFIVLVIATVEWFVNGRTKFKGPKVNLEALAHGDVMGITAEESVTNGHDRDNGTDGGEEDKSKAV